MLYFTTESEKNQSNIQKISNFLRVFLIQN